MTYINLDGANYNKNAIAAGRIPGAGPWVKTSHVEGLQTTDGGVLVWDSRTIFTFLTSAQNLEIVSASASDTSAGVGGRTVAIELIKPDYSVTTEVVTLNGLTPVAIPNGPYIFVNYTTVITAGSTFSNVGNLSVRVSGGGALQDFVLGGSGLSRAGKYMVPLGKRLIMDNIYLNTIGAGGATKTVGSDLLVKLPSGVELLTQRNFLLSDVAPTTITLPTGLIFNEKEVWFNRISSVSANNVNFAVSYSGNMVPMPT